MVLKFEKPEPLPLDPLVKALTEEQIESDIADYIKLLDYNASEAEVHDFLASHSYFFNTILRMYGASPLYSKIRLGSQYEVDFAFFDTGSYGTEWYLVEIEAPSKRMFTKAGDPTSFLTHAIQQVRDWHTWIHENLDYARKLMPHIEYPLGYVFIGRRAHLTHDTKIKLRRMAHDHRMFMHIHTLDWFAGTARSVKDLIRIGGGGNWPVPMHALSHTDLAAGRPEMARKWLTDPRVADELESGQQLILKQREYSYLNLAEFEVGDKEDSQES
jgi:hypothetical protein